MRSDWLLISMLLLLSALVMTYGRHDNRVVTSASLNGRKFYDNTSLAHINDTDPL